MNETPDDDWFDREQLHFAASTGDAQKVQQLLKDGFPIDAFDDLNFTPLHYAAQKGHLDIVKLLISKGADVNAHNQSKAGNTVLREVASNCSYEMAEILIKAGANPKLPGWMGITAIHLSEKRKRGDGPKIHALLLEASKRFHS